MAEQLYSENESLDRIFRLLIGEAVNEEPESLVPPLRSTNEALSAIAELLAGTLEGYQAQAPTALSIYGQIFTSDVDAKQDLASGTYTHVTQFAGNCEHAVNTTPDHTLDQITINRDGTCFVGYDVSFAGNAALYDLTLYLNSSPINETVAWINPQATGTYQGVSAIGIESVSAGDTLKLYVRANSEGADFALKAGSLWIKSV